MICVECGTSIDFENPIEPIVVDCPLCGTEMEVHGNNIIGLHLGPSEE
jgi:hypothetical protein